MWDDGHGRVHGRFTLPTLEGAALKKALQAIAAPKHQAATKARSARWGAEARTRADGPRVRRVRHPLPHRPAPQGRWPQRHPHRHRPPRPLLGGLKAAHLDTGQTISAALARRLACEAGIIPAILDGQSRVLDLGRKRRFHNHAQRVLATLEQHGCTAEGCDTPPGMCHLHHPIPWSQGGGTDRDALMLCPKHHRTAHDPALHDGQAPRREGRLQPANLSRPPPHADHVRGTVATRPPRTQLALPGVSRRSLRDLLNHRHQQADTRRAGQHSADAHLGFETVAARPPQPPTAKRTQARARSARAPAATR